MIVNVNNIMMRSDGKVRFEDRGHFHVWIVRSERGVGLGVGHLSRAWHQIMSYLSLKRYRCFIMSVRVGSIVGAGRGGAVDGSENPTTPRDV